MQPLVRDVVEKSPYYYDCSAAKAKVESRGTQAMGSGSGWVKIAQVSRERLKPIVSSTYELASKFEEDMALA